MDMKKKLNEAYMPDKSARAEKIAVALSGGIDSFVAAYLLKIQKQELIGLTAITGWEDYPGDQESTLSCVINNERLNVIKEFCHQLGIPHQTVKITSEFKEKVVEPWMADRAFGAFPNPCWNCHDTRMIALYERMKQMGAKYLATGHFAKLFHNDVHGTAFVHSSNDEQNDQSLMLARLPQEILNVLTLPLSDLQKKEVLKLSENFGLVGTNKKIKVFDCLPWDDVAREYVHKKIPLRFNKPGEIILADDLSSVTEHEGMWPHYYGELLKAKSSGVKEDLYLVDFNYQEKKLVVSGAEYFQRNRILLTDCEITQETPVMIPSHGALKISDDVYVDCWIHPKSLRAAYLEWDEKIALKEGEILGVYRKKGKNSKVYLTGKVQFLKEERVPVEGEKKSVKVDYASDY